MKLIKKYTILIVVCHPDDEALWMGGLIHALSKFTSINVNVICLSGVDNNSPREEEFFQAKAIAGYRKGVVLGGKLRAALDPLPPIAETVEAGMKKLGVSVADISLLITHSPYGDEQGHPHHIQTSEELYRWAKKLNIPFGYFSCLPVPSCYLQPLLKNMRHEGTFQVINFARCTYSLRGKLFRFLSIKPLIFPEYYIQFLTDGVAKAAMLACYQSINVAQHAITYSMFTSNCESIYIFDKRGVEPFKFIMEQMKVTGCENLFLSWWRFDQPLRKITKKILIRMKLL